MVNVTRMNRESTCLNVNSLLASYELKVIVILLIMSLFRVQAFNMPGASGISLHSQSSLEQNHVAENQQMFYCI